MNRVPKVSDFWSLNQWLLERYRSRETAVLILDEAQNLTYPVLEEIRLLTNLETSTEKLLQIVLQASRSSRKSSNFPNCGNCASGSRSAARPPR